MLRLLERSLSVGGGIEDTYLLPWAGPAGFTLASRHVSIAI